MPSKFHTIIASLLLFLLSACSVNTGRYQQKHDSTPDRLPHPHELKDAIPRDEPKSRGGNKDYTVLGKHYKVLANADNFQQTGIASYYGNKFHGHLTSNGEIYNMYDMSAAHKTLPLPTYVKVTNLSNNKSVIVRVNDRGPFHDDRIIDLSYSAAYKLDMLKKGTAQVKIESINYLTAQRAKENNKATLAPTISHFQTPQFADAQQHYIQVFATKSIEKAKNTANALAALYQKKVNWLAQDGIFRVQIGPMTSEEEVQQLLQNLRENGYPQAFPRKNTAE